jgi:hypothetical protein
MREWVKALPLGLGLPMVIGAASVKPEDAASNLAAWTKLFGVEHTPEWLSAPGTDNKVIVGSMIVAAIYAFLVWGVPAIKRQRNRPTEPVINPSTPVVRRAKIIFGTGHPFESIALAGKNKNRTVRVKIENNTDTEISNGTVRILSLDPPQKEHRNFFLKGDITIGARRHTFVDVAYYSEGTSEAPPAPSMRLCVPIPGGFTFNSLPGTLPLSPHTFQLQFSTLEDHVLDEVYCRLSVDQNHILHLEDWGDSAKLLTPTVNIQADLSLGAAYQLLDKAASFPAFLDRLYRELFTGTIQSWGRLAQGKNAWSNLGPEQPIPQNYWADSTFDWITVTKKPDKGGAESTVPGSGKEKYYKARFNTAQIKRFCEQLVA